MKKTNITRITKQIEKVANEPLEKKKKPIIKTEDLLPSGSTLLNLVCSNNPFGAFLKGKYYYLVGDSASGKTFLSMTCFAEALRHPIFKEYRLIYDNVEDGMLIDLEKLFNADVAEKVEPPGMEDDEPVFSFSIEEFYYHLDDALIKSKEEERPFIYVLDSMDGLSSVAEVEKFEEHKTAHLKGTKSPGSYGDGKAKKNSEGIRKILKGLNSTGSILIIISQTRDNLGFGHEKKTRSGGRALIFYATTVIWSSVTGKIKKTIKGKLRHIGNHIKLETKTKNRVTGELHEGAVDIYPSYGIDDTGSCIDYLVDEKWWGQIEKMIDAGGFNVCMSREKLIEHIEENDLYKHLQRITGECWKEIRKESALKRKKRY